MPVSDRLKAQCEPRNLTQLIPLLDPNPKILRKRHSLSSTSNSVNLPLSDGSRVTDKIDILNCFNKFLGSRLNLKKTSNQPSPSEKSSNDPPMVDRSPV